MELRDGSQRACVERMCRELINARTPMEILSAMNDVNQDQEAVSGAQPVEVDAGISSSGQTSFMLSPWSSSRSRSSSSESPNAVPKQPNNVKEVYE